MIDPTRYARPVYDADNHPTPLNKGDVPLWSGEAPPPAVGSVVTVGNGKQVEITGYEVVHGWLMAYGTWNDKPIQLTGRDID